MMSKQKRGPRDDPHGIERAMAAKGMNQRELERASGVRFQDIQRLMYSTPSGKPSNSQYLEKVKQALEISNDNIVIDHTKMPILNVGKAILIQALRSTERQGVLAMTEIVVDTQNRPESLERVPDAYGIQMRGTDMSPKYEPGDVLLINPHTPPRVGRGVVIVGSDKESVIVGLFESETDTEWCIKKLGETPRLMPLNKHEFPECHGISVVFPT